MFDGMPLGKRGKLDEGASAEIGDDRISTLPDALLSHVLSFLPAEEAVRTCLLAQRWRHLWKSSAGLRFGCLCEDEPKSVHELQRFVDHFLLLRGCSPLDTCELRIGAFSGNDDVPRVNLWFRHAVMCRVRVLVLHVYRNDSIDWFELDDLPLVSKTLMKLELHGVRCRASFLNFSSCPALENLHFEYCDLPSTKISSESIKSLSIIESALGDDSCVQMSAPNLVSLQLDDFWDRAPILDSMPALTGAFVRIAEHCDDRCNKMLDPYLDCNCESCESSDSIGDLSDNCVLLEGLSEARSLVLISTLPDAFIFKRDLRWCPMFYNLRTLLLDDYWCVPDDIHPLACILEHTPNLEKLTLQLFSEGPKHNVEMEGSFNSAVQSASISKYLRIIEIKCEVIDDRVAKVLKFLCTFNIRFSF